jgi:hypothetical protein
MSQAIAGKYNIYEYNIIYIGSLTSSSVRSQELGSGTGIIRFQVSGYRYTGIHG